MQTGSPLFCVDLFENVNLHRLVGHQTLEPRVLFFFFFFQCSESLGLADFHPPELPLPRVVGRRADIVRRTHRLYRAPGLSINVPAVVDALRPIGTSIMRLIPSDRQVEEREILARIGSGERLDHFETIRLAKDGRRLVSP